MAHCNPKKELTDQLNSVANEITDNYQTIDTREIDEMLTRRGDKIPHRHRYLVANRLKDRGWYCFFAQKTNREQGYLFFWHNSKTIDSGLQAYCERHGGRPETLSPWNVSSDDSKWTRRWAPMIAASNLLTAYFFGLRDYYVFGKQGQWIPT